MIGPPTRLRRSGVQDDLEIDKRVATTVKHEQMGHLGGAVGRSLNDDLGLVHQSPAARLGHRRRKCISAVPVSRRDRARTAGPDDLQLDPLLFAGYRRALSAALGRRLRTGAAQGEPQLLFEVRLSEPALLLFWADSTVLTRQRRSTRFPSTKTCGRSF